MDFPSWQNKEKVKMWKEMDEASPQFSPVKHSVSFLLYNLIKIQVDELSDTHTNAYVPLQGQTLSQVCPGVM